MDLKRIEKGLKAGEPLSDGELIALRDLARSSTPAAVDSAIELLRLYPEQTRVDTSDRPLLEAAADQIDSPFRAAHALSLLCDWLSLAQEEVGRIIFALVTRTDGGDYLCIVACSCAGLVLRDKSEPALARVLIDVFRDATRAQGTRESARNALLEIDGMTTREIVLAERADSRVLQQRAETVAERLVPIEQQGRA
jgi:hypothetical protein